MAGIAPSALRVFPKGQMPMRPTRLLQVIPADANGHFNAGETVVKMMHQECMDKLYPQYY